MQDGFFLRKKPFQGIAFPLHQLENRYKPAEASGKWHGPTPCHFLYHSGPAFLRSSFSGYSVPRQITPPCTSVVSMERSSV